MNFPAKVSGPIEFRFRPNDGSGVLRGTADGKVAFDGPDGRDLVRVKATPEMVAESAAIGLKVDSLPAGFETIDVDGDVFTWSEKRGLYVAKSGRILAIFGVTAGAWDDVSIFLELVGGGVGAVGSPADFS